MLKPRLYYVKWLEIPKPNSALIESYFYELKAILNSEDEAVYFLSDLRSGHITHARLMQRLASVLHHKNYAGGASFSEDPSAAFDMKMFRFIRTKEGILQGHDANTLFQKPEDAIAYIDSLENGITSDVEWDMILSDAIFSL